MEREPSREEFLEKGIWHYEPPGSVGICYLKPFPPASDRFILQHISAPLDDNGRSIQVSLERLLSDKHATIPPYSLDENTLHPTDSPRLVKVHSKVYPDYETAMEALRASYPEICADFLRNHNRIAFWEQAEKMIFLNENNVPQAISMDSDKSISIVPLEQIDPEYTCLSSIKSIPDYKRRGDVEDATELLKRHMDLRSILMEDGAVILDGNQLLTVDTHPAPFHLYSCYKIDVGTEPSPYINFLGLIAENRIERFAQQYPNKPVNMDIAYNYLIAKTNKEIAHELKLVGTWKTRNGMNAYAVTEDGHIMHARISLDSSHPVTTGRTSLENPQALYVLKDLRESGELLPLQPEPGQSPKEEITRFIQQKRDALRDQFYRNGDVLVEAGQGRLFVWDEQADVKQIYLAQITPECSLLKTHAAGMCLFRHRPQHDGAAVPYANADTKALKPISTFLKSDLPGHESEIQKLFCDSAKRFAKDHNLTDYPILETYIIAARRIHEAASGKIGSQTRSSPPERNGRSNHR